MSDSDLSSSKICVFYDGACPSCVKDRERYKQLAGQQAKDVEWYDITDRDVELKALGIDPHKALIELHIQTKDGKIFSELDAYILLMQHSRVLKPLAWLIGLPGIRPLLSRWYRSMVFNRLNKQGRL